MKAKTQELLLEFDRELKHQFKNPNFYGRNNTHTITVDGGGIAINITATPWQANGPELTLGFGYDLIDEGHSMETLSPIRDVFSISKGGIFEYAPLMELRDFYKELIVKAFKTAKKRAK